MPETHNLKCEPPWFADVASGAKTFEARRGDRGFAVGDVLVLREWGKWRSVRGMPERADVGYTGCTCRRTVTYILRHSDYPEGIAPGYCVLGLAKEGAADA